jgi:hypothetical protein
MIQTVRMLEEDYRSRRCEICRVVFLLPSPRLRVPVIYSGIEAGSGGGGGPPYDSVAFYGIA